MCHSALIWHYIAIHSRSGFLHSFLVCSICIATQYNYIYYYFLAFKFGVFVGQHKHIFSTLCMHCAYGIRLNVNGGRLRRVLFCNYKPNVWWNSLAFSIPKTWTLNEHSARVCMCVCVCCLFSCRLRRISGINEQTRIGIYVEINHNASQAKRANTQLFSTVWQMEIV